MDQSTARDTQSLLSVDDIDDVYNDNDNDSDSDIPNITNNDNNSFTNTSSPNAPPSSAAPAGSTSFDPDTAVVTTDRLKSTNLADGHMMINQYVLEAKVGSGQHGNVWRCHDHLNTSRILAMKIVKRDNPKAKRERQYKMLRQQNLPRTDHVPVVDGIRTAEQEIRREIAIMKRCRHPHVVRLHEVIDDRKNDQIYMVMEYLGGGEIKYTNEKREPILTVEQTRRIMRDAILGLEYLHHQGIIHRDIKPANLIWTANHDRVKIADFGTAHFSYAQRLSAVVAGETIKSMEDEDPFLLNEAALAKRAGSPAFLAPEIVWEYVKDPEPGPRPPVTKAIDIWALGVTLYCFLFGKTPFRPRGEYHLSEYTGYQYTCNHDWRAGPYMGYDRIPTGGRHPSMDEDEDGMVKEGPVVMHLLDHLLKKDYLVRITLEEVKMNRWFLHDLPNPDTWIEVTSPKPIVVSQEETSDAMSILKFRWNPFRRMGMFLRNTVASRGRNHRGSLAPSLLGAERLGQSRKGEGSRRRVKSARERDEETSGTMSEPNMRLRRYMNMTEEDVAKSKRSLTGETTKGKQRDVDNVERNRAGQGRDKSLSTSGQSRKLESEHRSKSSDDGLRKAAVHKRRSQLQQMQGHLPGPGQAVHQVHTASSLPTATQTLRAVMSQASSATSKSRRGSDARSTYRHSSSVSTSPTASSPYPSNPSSPHPSSTNSGCGELQSPSSSSLLTSQPSSQQHSPTGSHSRSHSKTPSFSSFPSFNLSSHSISIPLLGRPGKSKSRSRPGTPTTPVMITPTPAKPIAGATPTTATVINTTSSSLTSSLGSTRKGLSGIWSHWKQSRSYSQQLPSSGLKHKEKDRSSTVPASLVSSPAVEVDSPIDNQVTLSLAVSPGYNSALNSRDDLDLETSSVASASPSYSSPGPSTARKSSTFLTPNALIKGGGSSNSLGVPDVPSGYQSLVFEYGTSLGGRTEELLFDMGLERRTSSWDHELPREFEDFTSLHSDDGLGVRDVDDHVVYVGAGGVANRQELEEAERKGEQGWLEELTRKRIVAAAKEAKKNAEHGQQQGNGNLERKKKSIIINDESDDDEEEEENDTEAGDGDGTTTAGTSRNRSPHGVHRNSDLAEDDDSEVLTFSTSKKRLG